MTDTTLLGPWVRRFLLEHLIGERNLARNTQRSYRDTLAVLLPFTAAHAGLPIDRLTIDHLSAERVRAFLRHLEEGRGCALAARRFGDKPGGNVGRDTQRAIHEGEVYDIGPGGGAGRIGGVGGAGG